MTAIAKKRTTPSGRTDGFFGRQSQHIHAFVLCHWDYCVSFDFHDFYANKSINKRSQQFHFRTSDHSNINGNGDYFVSKIVEIQFI